MIASCTREGYTGFFMRETLVYRGFHTYKISVKYFALLHKKRTFAVSCVKIVLKFYGYVPIQGQSEAKAEGRHDECKNHRHLQKKA